MAHDVFISYASGDKAVADAVCAQLESIHRIRCWIAPRDITPGASWAESIIDALDASKIMVLIFSNSANASMQIEREVERAVHKGINIIPLRIENATPTKTLEYFISAPHWLDALTVPMEQHIGKLAVSVKALLARPGHAGRGGSVDPAHVAPAGGAAHSERPDLSLPTTPVSASVPTTTAAATTDAGPVRKGQRPLVLIAGALVIAIAAAAASRFLFPRSAPSPQPATADAVSSSKSAEPAAAPVTSDKPQPSPALVTLPSAVPAATPAVEPKPIKPNLFIDYSASLSEGTIVVNVDGQKKWSASLAPPPPKPGTAAKKSDDDRAFEQPLTIPAGKHKVTVRLLRPNGETRENEATDITTDENVVRTLRIRLSRFRHNLQLSTAVGPPESKSDKAKKP